MKKYRAGSIVHSAGEHLQIEATTRRTVVYKMPRVSVIMGVYNSNREWLLNSIDSICKQTFSDFEFVICNDASSNETYQWVKERAEQDSRIKLVSNSENQGLAASLNHCLEIAVGELIARQDDDDISELLRLEQQVQFLDQNPEYAWLEQMPV